MTTSPFAPEVEQLITGSHTQTFRAVAVLPDEGDLELDVLDHSVDWAEFRTPRVQARLDVTLPDNQDVLDQLDPRRLVRVKLFAGYVLPSGALDEQQVANLGLRRRTVTRDGESGDARMSLDLASDEALILDASGPNPSAADGTYTQPSLATAVLTVFTQLLDGTPAAGPGFVNEAPNTGTVTIASAPHPWDALSDVAEQYDQQIYDNGDRVFRIAAREPVVSESALTLVGGPNGTVLSSSTGADRDNWANWVTLTYEWTDAAGASQSTGNYARVLPGSPFAPEQAGYKILTEVRDMPSTEAAAGKVAASILRRMLARARTYTIDAVPAWWLRPGHTVTVQLPLGDQERHLVAAVGFSPGRMTIQTRLPDNASTIGE